jgi:hypothetical protein
MEGIKVERLIPAEYLEKINTGEYTVWGGVIRQAMTGRIVAHLQIAGFDLIRPQLDPSLQPLLNASLALNAMNLAVSVAGFAVVVRKLDAINQKLDHISDKLTQLLTSQMQAAWERELERRTRFAATCKTMDIGLRTHNDQLINQSIAALMESAEFYRAASKHLLEDISGIYREPIPFRRCVEMALAASLVLGHTIALQGHPPEAVRLLHDLQGWQESQLRALEQPLHGPRKHLWLGRLDSNMREECRSLVRWQRQIPEGLAYAENQYQLCVEYGIAPDELTNLTEGVPLALLIPVEKDQSEERGR